GAAGLNIEDTDHASADRRLVDAERQAERITQLKEAGRAAGVELVINARVDVFVLRQGTLQEQAAEGHRRAAMYRQAGADCVYPILLSDEALISEFVARHGVININVRPGGPISLARAAELGVRRVSYATSLFNAMQASLESLTEQVLQEASGIQMAR